MGNKAPEMQFSGVQPNYVANTNECWNSGKGLGHKQAPL